MSVYYSTPVLKLPVPFASVRSFPQRPANSFPEPPRSILYQSPLTKVPEMRTQAEVSREDKLLGAIERLFVVSNVVELPIALYVRHEVSA